MSNSAKVQIVVAEDSGADVILIEESLRNAGLDADLKVFPDGEECAWYLKSGQEPPQAIILDLNLPRVSGFELLQTVRDQPRYNAVPVAVLTSSRLAEDRRKSLAMGADAFITKPCTLDEFLETVGAAIRRLVLPPKRVALACHH